MLNITHDINYGLEIKMFQRFQTEKIKNILIHVNLLQVLMMHHKTLN